jgi:hypothetical protein
MKRIAIALFAITIFSGAVVAQKPGATPTDTVLRFYRALRDKKYVEGFRHSVYRGAVEGLTADELRDLEPDFARAFSEIPEKLEPRGEKVEGEKATVMLKFDGADEVQPVSLIREGGEWVVGDKDALAMVRSQGRSFFFNTRMIVNEEEAFKMVARIMGAEVIYSQKFEGRCASMQDLIRLGGVPKDLETGEANGYRFSFTLSQDQKSFTATAVPLSYGKTGRLSFYADLSAVRAEDLKGRLASSSSPLYQPR